MRRLLFMSHRLLGGNRLSPRQLGLISNSPRVIPKTLRTTNLQSITTKCKQRLSLGRSLGRPCPRRHALGMLSLAGSVPAPCERRTYTRKHNPVIFMQWGWELSQQWSSGEFRQIKVCNQKGQKGSTGRLGAFLGKPVKITFVRKKGCKLMTILLLRPGLQVLPHTDCGSCATLLVRFRAGGIFPGSVSYPCKCSCFCFEVGSLSHTSSSLCSQTPIWRAFLGKPVKITCVPKKGCKLMDQI